MKLYLISIVALMGCFSSLTQGCEVNEVEHTWNQGQNNKLRIEAPAKIFKWKVEIEYDTAPSRLDAYQGRGEKCKKDTNICEFKNENFNRRLKAGELLEVGYQIQFPQDSDAPEIVSLKFLYCDAKPCPMGKDTEGWTELRLCPGEEETEAPTTPAETTVEATQGTTQSQTGETTVAPTGAPTEVTTDGSATTAPSDDTTEGTGDGGCIGELTEFNAWEYGASGRFQITVPDDIDEWEVTVTFDQPMDSIEAYEGSDESCDGETCTFTNENWNGALAAGTVLSLGFQAPGDFPEIMSFTFNGAACEAPPTTTETAETTTQAVTGESTVGSTGGSTEASTGASTTEAAESTTAAEGDCPESEVTQVWGSGMKGKLEFEVAGDLDEWEVSIIFDGPINSCDAFQGKDEIVDGTTCTFTSEQWNAVQTSGNTLTLEYQAQFDETATPPNVVGFSFNGVPVCEGPTGGPTDATTTGGPSDGTTDESTDPSTDVPGEDTTPGECIGELIEFHAWESAATGRFQINVPDDIDEWEVTVTFDQPMDSIEAYEGSGETCDGDTCTFTNENWNGAVTAGTVLSLGFQAPGDFPEILSFTFNGAACEAPPTTTEAAETTTEAVTGASTEGSTGGSTEASTGGSTTEAAESTTVAEGDCPESEVTQVWGSGMKGKLELEVPGDLDEWEVSIIFDGPINSCDAFQGKDEIVDGTTCTFTSEQWNAVQASGNTLTLEYQIQFDETTTPPNVAGFSFNGAPICEGPTGGPTDATTTGGPDDGTTGESTDSSTDLPGEDTTPGECILGADYPGAIVGHLTHYSSNPTGNNCDLDWTNLEASGLDGWTYFGALPKNTDPDADRYESGLNCGRCVKVKCSCEQELFDGACQPNGQEVILMVTDSCPSCPYVGDLDLSTNAWNDVTGNEDPSKFDGTWEFIECPSNFKQGPMKLRMKDGTSQWWYALQPENHKNKVTGMDITFNGVTTELIFGEIDGFWWKGVDGMNMEFPALVEAKNEAGEVCATITLNSEDELKSGVNTSLEMEGEC